MSPGAAFPDPFPTAKRNCLHHHGSLRRLVHQSNSSLSVTDEKRAGLRTSVSSVSARMIRVDANPKGQITVAPALAGSASNERRPTPLTDAIQHIAHSRVTDELTNR